MTATQDMPLTKAEIPLDDNGIVLCKTYDALFRYADSVFKSGLAPESFKSPTAILVAMQHGAEIGMKPLQALQNIAVIGKKPSLYGKALPALVMQHGLMDLFEEWIEGEGDQMTAYCKTRRKGFETPRVDTFSVADAKRAGLWGKQTWALYPKDMLKYKARARNFNAQFADVLCGLPTFEDVREVYEAEVKEKPKGHDPLLDKVAGPKIKNIEAEILPAGDSTAKPVKTPEPCAPIARASVPASDDASPSEAQGSENSVLVTLQNMQAAASTEELPGVVDHALSLLTIDQRRAAFRCANMEPKDVEKAKTPALRRLLHEIVEAVKD